MNLISKERPLFRLQDVVCYKCNHPTIYRSTAEMISKFSSQRKLSQLKLFKTSEFDHPRKTNTILKAAKDNQEQATGKKTGKRQGQEVHKDKTYKIKQETT